MTAMAAVRPSTSTVAVVIGALVASPIACNLAALPDKSDGGAGGAGGMATSGITGSTVGAGAGGSTTSVTQAATVAGTGGAGGAGGGGTGGAGGAPPPPLKPALLVWSASFPSAAQAVPADVAMRPDGGAVIAGRFNGELDFGDGKLVASVNPKIFVASFAGNGKLAWSRAIDGDGNGAWADSVAVDAAGNVILAGNGEIVPDYVKGRFVATLDPAGKTVSASLVTSLAPDNAKARAAVDSQGNVLTAPVQSLQPVDPLLAKVRLSKSGPSGWSIDPFLYGSTIVAEPSAIGAGLGDDAFVAGWAPGGAYIGGGGALPNASGIFLGHIGGAGAVKWVSSLASLCETAGGLAVDAASNVTTIGIACTASDPFLAKLNASGAKLWLKTPLVPNFGPQLGKIAGLAHGYSLVGLGTSLGAGLGYLGLYDNNGVLRASQLLAPPRSRTRPIRTWSRSPRPPRSVRSRAAVFSTSAPRTKSGARATTTTCSSRRAPTPRCSPCSRTATCARVRW